MKKKKVILAILASLCVAAGTAGIVACTGGNSGPSYDPALYAAYQKYTESAGDHPMGYEEWLADILDKFYAGGKQGPQGDIGETGDSIKSVEIVTISDKEYYEFTFTSGRIIRLATDGSGDRQETTAFTVKAVDTNGTPIANAYFSIGYYDASAYRPRFFKADGTTTTDPAAALAIKSNERGIAIFNTFLSAQREYCVYIADPNAVVGAKSGIPDGYSVIFGIDEAIGMTKNNETFTKEDDFNYSARVRFRIDNSWGTLYDEDNDLQYSRYVKSGESDITEEHTPYVKSAAKGKYNYFTLMPFPYKLINSIDTTKSYKAAEGVYRVRWTASVASAKVELYLYDFVGTPQLIKTNADGSPADSHVKMHSGKVPTNQKILQERYEAYTKNEGMLNYNAWLEEYSKSFSGSNYVDVEITEDFNAINFSLAYVSDTDCDVTITVERIGDAATWTVVNNTVEMPTDATKAKNNTEGRRIMSVPFGEAIYKDSDGFYRLGSVTGDLIYVQLKNATRVNAYSMEYLAHYKIETDAESDPYRTMFNYYTEEFNEATNSGVRTFTNYTNVVLGYANLSNTDGLYPVNDLLKTVLEEFCRGYYNGDDYWVAACYYYGFVPSGTEDAPYEITTGSSGNTINLNNGSAYVYFTSSTTAYYGFYSTDGAIEGIEDGVYIEGAAIGDKAYNITYVKVEAFNDLVFKVSGSGSTATVIVASFDGNHPIIQYWEDSDTEHGTASNPIAAKAGVLQVTVDLDMYDGYIEVNLTSMTLLDGNYKISVLGSSTAIVVDADGNDLVNGTVALTAGTALRIRITDIQSGTFFLNIKRVD